MDHDGSINKRTHRGSNGRLGLPGRAEVHGGEPWQLQYLADAEEIGASANWMITANC